MIDGLALYTASVFRLDPTATTPIEPLADIIPGITPLRVTFDSVDSESYNSEYDTTEHAVQAAGVIDFTSHVRKRLKSLQITGTLGALLPLVLGPAPPQLPFSPRLDVLRLRNLEAIADARQPVAVSTPRVFLRRCLITSLQASWAPAENDSIIVALSLREVRFVSPLTGDFITPDYPAQTPGNNEASGGGQSATTPVNETATASSTPGVPPTLSAGAP